MENAYKEESHFGHPTSLSDLLTFLINSRHLDVGPTHKEVDYFLSKACYISLLEEWSLCLARLGRFEKALAKQKEALHLQIELFGENHSNTALILRSLGISLYSLGRYSEASNKLEQALNIQLKLFDSKYHEVGETLHYLANCQAALGKIDEALNNQEKALNIFKERREESPLLVATFLSNMGNYLFCNGDYKGAHQKYKEALAIQKEKLDENHPDVLFSLTSIDICNQESMSCEIVPVDYEMGNLSKKDFYELVNYAMNSLESNCVIERNPSGFLRIRLTTPPNFRLASEIETLRIHYWPEKNLEVVEAMHNHPRHFQSMILTGGYTHILYKKDKVSDHSNFRVHRIVKCSNSIMQRNIFCLGTVPLALLNSETTKRNSIIVFPKHLIHQVTGYQKGTLTVNAVFKNKSNPTYFDVFMRENKYTDPQVERDCEGENSGEVIIVKIKGILQKWMEENQSS